jgi:hypothetical protein
MRRAFAICAALAFGLVTAARANFIDFESVPAGTLASNALASYGISSISNTGSGTYVDAQCRDMTGPGDVIPSGVNMFLPAAYWYPNSGIAATTLTFSTPVNSFSFKKLADSNVPLVIGIAGWKAEAFDESAALVDSDGIGFAGGLDFPSPLPHQSFTLSGPAPIKTVTFTINYNWMSTIGTVPVDDFQFDPIPEPALGGAALAFLALYQRHHRRG